LESSQCNKKETYMKFKYNINEILRQQIIGTFVSVEMKQIVNKKEIYALLIKTSTDDLFIYNSSFGIDFRFY
jgi:hypothetical protein